MRPLVASTTLVLLTACALQAYPPYRLHAGEALPTEAKSTIKVARSFGGPAVYLTYVDKTYVLDFPSMKGYPKDAVEANRLEPKTVEVLPGPHALRVNFAFTDLANKVQLVTLLTLVGVSPTSYATFRKSADIEFVTMAAKTYLIKYTWDESKGAAGVAFSVDECSADERTCNPARINQSNEKVSVTSNFASPAELMAR